VAFTKEAKRAHRAKPEVRQRERDYYNSWYQANRERVSKYKRDYYRGRVESGVSTTTNQLVLYQLVLFDANNKS
jgi:hypothetical protein